MKTKPLTIPYKTTEHLNDWIIDTAQKLGHNTQIAIEEKPPYRRSITCTCGHNGQPHEWWGHANQDSYQHAYEVTWTWIANAFEMTSDALLIAINLAEHWRATPYELIQTAIEIAG